MGYWVTFNFSTISNEFQAGPLLKNSFCSWLKKKEISGFNKFEVGRMLGDREWLKFGEVATELMSVAVKEVRQWWWSWWSRWSWRWSWWPSSWWQRGLLWWILQQSKCRWWLTRTGIPFNVDQVERRWWWWWLIIIVIMTMMTAHQYKYGFSFSMLTELKGSRRNQVANVNPVSWGHLGNISFHEALFS